MLRRLLVLLCLGVSFLAIGAPPALAQLPTGFSEGTVPGLESVSQPTAFAFLPDGRMLITTKPGRLLLYENGALRGTPVFDRVIDICDTVERGLLGVAVDPAFNNNRRVYVYYTFDKHDTKQTSATDCDTNTSLDPVNRVSRLTLSQGMTTADETVLIDNIPSPNGNHNAGDLHFGKDGFLYISTGDGGRNETARERHNLDGAILRITGDGGIPSGNPYTAAGSGRCYDPAPGGNKSGSLAPGQLCQEIFAYGLRNPFRIAFDPNAAGTRFFINDVGQGNAEEISVGAVGADYGWNCYEGTLPRNVSGCNPLPTGTVAPYFEYRRGPTPPGQPSFFNGCNSITAGAFVPAGVWPSEYDGAYMFADYVCQRIFSLRPGAGGPTPASLIAGRVVTHMAFGPFAGGQALYIADFGAGRIRYIEYNAGGNRSPLAQLSATPLFGPAPLLVRFDGAGSSDPDSGDRVAAYLWSFGDGQSRETTGATTDYSYPNEGSYTATLRVRDTQGAVSAPATVEIFVGNRPPTAQIDAPAPGSLFRVGERLTLSATASDPEDGPLSGASVSWEVRRHHAEHWHPYHNATGTSTSLTAPGPEDFAAVDNSYLEIRLTVTDSEGLATLITREVRPRIVQLNFTTEPAGLRVTVDDDVSARTLATPENLRVWAGQAVELSAPTGQTAGGTQLKLCGWRHGGTATQTYSVNPAVTALRAVFVATDAACPALVGGGTLYIPLIARR